MLDAEADRLPSRAMRRSILARGERGAYLQQLDTADRQEPSEALTAKTSRLKEKIEKLKEEMQRLERLKVQMLATPDQRISLTDPDSRWRPAAGAPVSWATMSRSPSIPHII